MRVVLLVLIVGGCRAHFEEHPVIDAAPSYAGAVIEDQPIAYYRLDETSGTTAHDQIAGLDGVISAGCTPGVPGALGDGNAAMRFDGNACMVTLPDEFDFSGNQPFTIEAWIAATSDPIFRAVFSHESRDTQNPIDGYALLVSPPGVELERVIASSNSKTMAVPVPAEPFVYAVAVYDGGAMLLYIDGALQRTQPDARSLTPITTPTLIGATVSGNRFLGVADEVAIYNKALTPDRIALHHTLATQP